ncbi:MAG: hypothetical protein OXU81_00395 [Gammaproteobacteria bacterium]|nr:hypothetical protein [Gammaproteobacteria bacterium]
MDRPVHAAFTIVRYARTRWIHGVKLGKLTVDKITTAHVLAVLVPHWTEKRETMRRVRQRIGTIMK